MAFTDAVMRAFREFVRYTGDGLPNEPLNAALPVGDPRSGTFNPPKKEVRDALLLVADEINTAVSAAAAAAASAASVESALSDAVSQGNVPIYATRNGIQSIDVPSGLSGIRVNGYATATDQGGGYYVPVVSEPSHAGKVQDSGGAWYELLEAEPNIRMFGAVGNGTTDDSTAISNAVAYVAAKGGTLILPKGTYRVVTNLNVTVPFRALPGAIIKPDSAIRVSLQSFGDQAPGPSLVDTSAGGTNQFSRQWARSLRISDFLTSPDSTTDQSAAFRSAFIELFSGRGYNTLDLEGRTVQIGTNVSLIFGEGGLAADINAMYQRNKIIKNGKLRWAGAAASPNQSSSFMISIEAPAVNSGYLFSGLDWVDVVFDASGYAKNLLRLAGYYEFRIDGCVFNDYAGACAVLLDDVDNDGAYVSGNGSLFTNCRWRGLEYTSPASPLGCPIRSYNGDVIIEGGNCDTSGSMDFHSGPLTVQNVHFSYASSLTAGMTMAITLRDPREVLICNNDMDNCGILITNEGHAASLPQNAATNWRTIYITGNKVTLNDDPPSGYGWITLTTNQAGTIINGLTIGPNSLFTFTGSGADAVAELAFRTPAGGSITYGYCSGLFFSSGSAGARPGGGQFGPSGTTEFPFTHVSEAEVRTPLVSFSGNSSFGGGIKSDGASGMYLRSNGVDRWNLIANGNLAPTTDNNRNLGSPSNRCAVIYAGTGTIDTSDEREKVTIEAIPEAWLDAWRDVEWYRYKFASSVDADPTGARWHVGLIAQRIRDAFLAHGIDPFEIGLLCYDEWPAEQAIMSGSTVITPARAAGDRYGIRYSQALAMESAWVRRAISSIS